VKINLTELQKDALKEIASIGVSHAATSLSKILNEKVMIVVPEVSVLPLKHFPEVLGKNLIIGIYFRILAEASGRALISFEKESAFNLIDVILKREIGTTKVLTEYDQSALNETITIFIASALNALADFLGMTFMPSVPHFTFDYPEVIVEKVFQDIPKKVEYIVSIESEFRTEKTKIQGKAFIFPDENALKVIWNAIGKYIKQGIK
jgi:chemotaxis protein CheC